MDMRRGKLTNHSVFPVSLVGGREASSDASPVIDVNLDEGILDVTPLDGFWWY